MIIGCNIFWFFRNVGWQVFKNFHQSCLVFFFFFSFVLSLYRKRRCFRLQSTRCLPTTIGRSWEYLAHNNSEGEAPCGVSRPRRMLAAGPELPTCCLEHSLRSRKEQTLNTQFWAFLRTYQDFWSLEVFKIELLVRKCIIGCHLTFS